MLAVLDHLAGVCNAGGAQQLPELGQVLGGVVRERGDQVRALPGTALRSLPVD
jgi:hypothetical protein